jgi:hypothetical protein
VHTFAIGRDHHNGTDDDHLDRGSSNDGTDDDHHHRAVGPHTDAPSPRTADHT